MGLLAFILAVSLSFELLVQGSAANVPAIYVFGDSTADVGNNNYLPGDDAKANFAPYGIDFPHSTATGRSSNGYNTIDFIASHMGFKRSPPPYLSLTNKTHHRAFKGLRGASFASGGSGILDSTGSTITMTKQVQYFKTLQSIISRKIGTRPTEHLLSNSIFLISSGGNDIFGFFSQNSNPISTQKEQFISTLISNYKNHILALYNMGARKFAIIDVGPAGCCPYARALNPVSGCISVLNDLALGFSGATKVLMNNLASELKGLEHSVGSSYAVVKEIIDNPNTNQGHIEVENGCCGSGKFNAQVPCNQNTTYCKDRSHYLFWDMLHPTQATGKKVGLALYGGSKKYATPINFKQLTKNEITM